MEQLSQEKEAEELCVSLVKKHRLDMDVTHVHFTSMAYYPSGNWEPFVMAGLGAAHFSPSDSTLDDTTRFSMQIGGGTNYRLTDNFLLRLDVRWLGTFFNGSDAKGVKLK